MKKRGRGCGKRCHRGGSKLRRVYSQARPHLRKLGKKGYAYVKARYGPGAKRAVNRLGTRLRNHLEAKGAQLIKDKTGVDIKTLAGKGWLKKAIKGKGRRRH